MFPEGRTWNSAEDVWRIIGPSRLTPTSTEEALPAGFSGEFPLLQPAIPATSAMPACPSHCRLFIVPPSSLAKIEGTLYCHKSPLGRTQGFRCVTKRAIARDL